MLISRGANGVELIVQQNDFNRPQDTCQRGANDVFRKTIEQQNGLMRHPYINL